MSEAMILQDVYGFEAALKDVLRERRAMAVAPMGLEQRLLARLAQQDELQPATAPVPFRFTEAVRTPRSARSVWFAIGAHGMAAALLLCVLRLRLGTTLPPMPVTTATLIKLAAPPLVRPAKALAGGGGGRHEIAPASAGHLPKLSQTQQLASKIPPVTDSKFEFEPSIVVQKDLKMADSKLPSLGDPSSTLKGFSLGNGSGAGIGSGRGAGMGTGEGGNAGGGVMHVGGSVLAPSILVQVDPEFSEEARKVKFSGNVLVGLIVDAHGSATHVHVVRGAGLGLDEKAVEAVRQYKFKPATQNGKPVNVELTIE